MKLNNGWLPMDSAPKKGRFLACNEDNKQFAVEMVFDMNDTSKFAFAIGQMDTGDKALVPNLVAWRPIPAGPFDPEQS